MAKILVCADGFFRSFSPIGLEPLIEGFIQSLVANGHTVMPYIHHDLASLNGVVKRFVEPSFVAQVKEFTPDLIFAFNNRLHPKFLTVTDCPVYIVASDTPVYWSDHDLIRTYNDRYRVLYFNDDLCDEVKERFSIGYDRQFLIPYATSVKADPSVAPRHDISFIGNFYNGSMFLYDKVIARLAKQADYDTYRQLCHLIEQVRDNPVITQEMRQQWNMVAKAAKCNVSCDAFVREIMAASTSEMRQNLMASVSDMDLHIFSWAKNLRIAANNPALAIKSHLDPVYSIADNERVYNASRISLTLPHAQVMTGFSWRVCDILASNALLLSNKTRDIDTLFAGLIPTYNDPMDLRDKCAYYLSHENERRDIVRQCQQIIDKNHRYENMLQIVAECTGMTMVNAGPVGRIENFAYVEKKQAQYIKTKKRV